MLNISLNGGITNFQLKVLPYLIDEQFCSSTNFSSSSTFAQKIVSSVKFIEMSVKLVSI